MIFADGDVVTVQTLLIAGLASVVSALGMMWRIVERNRKECEDDRRKLWLALIDIGPKTCGDLSCEDRQSLPMAKVSLSTQGRNKLNSGDIS